MSRTAHRLVSLAALAALSVTMAAPALAAPSTKPAAKPTLQQSLRRATANDSMSMPTFTSPLAGSVVSGDASVSASSTAASVQFAVDGTPLALATVTGGTASTPWSTWSLANGNHTLSAADCTDNVCNTPATETVSVLNADPAVTAPASGATVTGSVTLTGTSPAPQVRFSVDGVSLGVVATSSGSASTTWSSFGYSNGNHDLGIASCDAASACGTPVTETVDVENAAPTVTSPTDAQVVGSNVTFTADAPGGGIAYLVDGTGVGYAASAPYTLTISTGALDEGGHDVTAISCIDATSCDGPVSDAVHFTVKALHPVLVSAASPISPNGDKKVDTSRIVLRLPDTESVIYRIKAPDGSTFAGPRSLGSLAKGDHAFVWDGKSNSRKNATSGLYTVAVSTTGTVSGVEAHGSTTKLIRVDVTAPTVTHLTGANKTFYPVHDGYSDTFTPGVEVSEGSSLTLKVYNLHGTLQRSLTVTAPSSGRPYQIGWNGHTTHGAQVPAGSYRFAFTATDHYGNAHTTGRYAVVVSLKKLVGKSAVLIKHGDGYSDGGESDSCAGGSTTHSAYPHGLWLQNYCDPAAEGTQVVVAQYTWTVPTAIRYTSLRFAANGFSSFPGSKIFGATYNYRIADVDAFTDVAPTSARVWRTLSSPTVTDHLHGRTMQTVVALVNNSKDKADYDINEVRLTVGYQVLQ